METRRLPVVQDHVNADLCQPCGGKCCQNFPGLAVPSDFGTDKFTIESALLVALESGRWALEYVENGPWHVLAVRPVIKGREGHAFDDSFRGVCTFHSAEGCEIFENRPYQCRSLEPKPELRCVQHSRQWETANAWHAYQRTLVALLELF